MNRRELLKHTAWVTAAAAVGRRTLTFADDASAKLRAAVIGHTGRGNYGHEMDVVFNDHPRIEVVAVADPDAGGRAQAAQRSKAPQQYDDYRKMLQSEKPNLVSVAPRWTDQHRDMCLAAFAVGAHVIMEKPFAPDAAQGDEILAAAAKVGRKICVAHQMPLSPGVVALKKALGEGLIGDLLQVRAWGKQDGRAGGEDMMVLGTHMFHLMRHLAGDPEWCTARVTQTGKDITAADARRVGEDIGPVAGDEVEAQFGLPNNVLGSFTSRGRLREQTGHWGMELTGSRGAVRILANVYPAVLVLKPGKWDNAGRTDEWKPLDAGSAGGDSGGFLSANRRLVDDWLDAIATDREPVCGGQAAAKAVEMVMAVYQAGISRSRVAMPLKDRKHPLMG
jgi:predicted dehydrogenase